MDTLEFWELTKKFGNVLIRPQPGDKIIGREYSDGYSIVRNESSVVIRDGVVVGLCFATRNDVTEWVED